MSGEAAKERVTPVPFKSGLLTYFRLVRRKARHAVYHLLEVIRLREKTKRWQVQEIVTLDSTRQ